MIDGIHIIFGIAKAEGAVADQFDFVVHSFQCSIADAQLGPSEDTFPVTFDKSCEVFNRLQPAAACPAIPFLQMSGSSCQLMIAPE